MVKFLFSILLAAFMTAVVWMPGAAHAEPFQRSDYASMEVPDLSQALSFFRNVLDCEALDADPTSTQHVLIICSNGMVVELVTATGHGSSAKDKDAPLRFAINDVAHADRWLRRGGARVVGDTIAPDSGPNAGQVLVNFITPWGQPLQLMGPADPKITALP